jgi:hypothetical protein
MKHVKISATQIEAHEGGNTMWVHDALGGTALRIQCSGQIVVDKQCSNIGPHADLKIEGDIHLCMPEGRRKSPLCLVENALLDELLAAAEDTQGVDTSEAAARVRNAARAVFDARQRL